ncbi:MAG: hypothetical protein ACLSEY_18490 [Enterocloster sp.]
MIRMLEKGILSENDFQTVIEAYKDDSISMGAIKEAVTGNHENGASNVTSSGSPGRSAAVF